jgi:hypothetical protein
MSPRRICSPLADVVAARVPAGPCPDFDSVVLFVGGDHCDVAVVGGGLERLRTLFRQPMEPA